MLRSKLSLLPLIVLVGAVAGCDQTKEALGLKRSAPDEMQVISRSPLSMPPGYGLCPPLPAQQGAADTSYREDAEASLLKKEETTVSSSHKSATESELLKQAKADATDPNIRKKIESDAKDNELSFGERLAFWTDNKKKGQVIDPQEESEKHKQEKQKSTQVALEQEE